MKNLSYLLQYLLIRVFAFALNLLPIGFAYWFARMAALLAYDGLRIRRQVTLDNLQLVLGKERERAQLIQIGRLAYQHIGMSFIEMLLTKTLCGKMNRLVDLTGNSTLKRYLARGRGLIVVAAHFGSWEMIGAASAAGNITITGVAAMLANPYVDAFINRARNRLGMETVPLTASAKQLVACLKEGKTIGLVADQNAGAKGVFVDFFGRPASTPRGPAQLALKYRAPMVAVMMLRTSPGHYRTVIKEVEVREDDTVRSLTQRYTKILEENIRQCPEQYFWMHRRWKTRPEEGVKQ